MGYLGGHSFTRCPLHTIPTTGIPLSFRFFSISFTGSEEKYASLPSFYYKLVARLVSGVVGNARVHYVHGYHLGSNGGSPSGLTYAHHRVGLYCSTAFLRTSPAFPNTVGTSSFKISAPCISFFIIFTASPAGLIFSPPNGSKPVNSILILSCLSLSVFSQNLAAPVLKPLCCLSIVFDSVFVYFRQPYPQLIA